MKYKHFRQAVIAITSAMLISFPSMADEVSLGVHSGSRPAGSGTTSGASLTVGKGLSLAYRYEPFAKASWILKNLSFEGRYLHWFRGNFFSNGTSSAAGGNGVNLSVAPVITVNTGTGLFAQISHGPSLGLGYDPRVQSALRFTSFARVGIADEHVTVSAGYFHISSGADTENLGRDYATVELGVRFGAAK